MSSYKPNTHIKPTDELHNGTVSLLEDVWREFLIDFKDEFKGNVLDVGCGDGYITKYCQEKLFNPGTKMSGCDLSEKMVEFCKEQRPGFEFFQLDVTVDIDNKLFNKYNGIFNNLMLHYIPEPRKCLENFHKLLVEGGFFFCSFFVNSFQSHKEMLELNHPEWSQHVRDYKSFVTPFQELEPKESERKFKEMMSDVGFKDVQTKIVTIKGVNENLEKFKGIIRMTDAFYSRLEESKAERYLDAMMKLYIDKKQLLPENPDKPILDHPELPVYIYLTVLAVTAKK